MPCVVKPGKINWSWIKRPKERLKSSTSTNLTTSSSDGDVSSRLDKEIGAMRLWLSAIHANILEDDQKTNSILIKRRLEIMKKYVNDGNKLLKNATNTSPGVHKTLINIHKTILTNAKTFKVTSLLPPPVYAEGEITPVVKKSGRLQTVYRTLFERYRIWRGRRLRKACLKKTRSDLTRLARKGVPSRKPKKGSYFHRNIVERMSHRTHGSRIKVKGIVRTKLVTLTEEEKKSPRGKAVKVPSDNDESLTLPVDSSESRPQKESCSAKAGPTPLTSSRESLVPIAENFGSQAATTSTSFAKTKTTLEDTSSKIKISVMKDDTKVKSPSASPELLDKSQRIGPKSPRSPRSPSLLESDTDILATSPRPSGMLPPLEKSPKPRRKKKVLDEILIDDLGLKAQRLSVALPPIKKSPETSPREPLAYQNTSNSTNTRYTDTAVLGAIAESQSGSSIAQDEVSNMDNTQAQPDLVSSTNTQTTKKKTGAKGSFIVKIWTRMKMLFCGRKVHPKC